jgi:SulP family sulfate permease
MIGSFCRHKEVFGHNKFHAGLISFTAVLVPATDFLTGVLSALTVLLAGRLFFDKPDEVRKSVVIDDAASKQQQNMLRRQELLTVWSSL